MSKRDYYEILNVARNASEADIRQAYRRLAMKYHPDRNPGDQVAEDNFKEAKEAYEILADARKRAAYDQFGHAGLDNSAGGGYGGSADLGDLFGGVFRDIFGGGRGGGGQGYRGSDLRYTLDLTLEEAVFGTTAKIRIPTLVSCAVALAVAPSPAPSPRHALPVVGSARCGCSRVFSQSSKPVRAARAEALSFPEPCETCRGSGRVEEQKTLSVKVPAGVDNGDRIRLAGEGEHGEQSGPPGDLYVQIQVKPHPIFTREESDLYCQVPISFTAAALGGELEVPTLDGRVSLKIPAETQTGKVFRIARQGRQAGARRADRRSAVPGWSKRRSI
jgi:molecular chaperone DnaJ